MDDDELLRQRLLALLPAEQTDGTVRQLTLKAVLALARVLARVPQE